MFGKLTRALRNKVKSSARNLLNGVEINPKAYYLAHETSPGVFFPVDNMPIESWSAARKKAKKKHVAFVLGSTLLKLHTPARNEVAQVKAVREAAKLQKTAQRLFGNAAADPFAITLK